LAGLENEYVGFTAMIRKSGAFLCRIALMLALALLLMLVPAFGQDQERSEEGKPAPAPTEPSATDQQKKAADEEKKAEPPAKKAVAPASTAAKKASGSAAKPKTVRAGSAQRQPGSPPVGVGNTMVTMNFRGADIDRILDFFGSVMGLTVIKDPSLTGTATIIAPKPIPVEQAFNILNAYLETRGYTAVRENGMLKVRPQRQGGGPGFGFPGAARGGTEGGSDTSGGRGSGQQGFGGLTLAEPETRVFQLKYAGAQSISRIINELFRDTGGSQQQVQQRMQQIMQLVGRQFGGPGGGNQQQRDRMQNILQRLMPMIQSGASSGTARASFDTYSNSVVVTAPPKLLEQIQAIIEELDQQVSTSMKTQVFTLKYVDCTEMARVVSSLLVATASGGASSGALRDVPFEARVFAAARAGGSGALASATGQVVAHEETNSIIVTASPDTLQTIASVIEKLDVKPEYQSTTFVFPLEKASANDVANILSSMFGRRTTGGFGFGGFFNQNQQQTQRRRLNQQGSGRSGFGGTGSGFSGMFSPGFTFRGQAGGGMAPFSQQSIQPMANDLPVNPKAQSRSEYNAASSMVSPYQLAVDGEDEFAPPDEEEAEYQGNAVLAQFGVGGGAAGTGARRTSTARTGRGPGGQISQLADLLNNLIVVPDANSNSLIISVDPAYVEVLQQILRSLDVVPEQVLIEAIIVEATLDDSTKLGFNWTFTNPGVAGKGTAGTGEVTVQPTNLTGGLTYTLVGADFQTILNTLSTDHRFKVLSTPRILTANNRQAQINISQQVPFITSQFVSPTGSQTTSFGFLDVGIILDVTPRISRNGYVTIDVIQEANEFQGFTAFNAPLVSRRSTETTVTVKDGQTVILGGLIKDTETTTTTKVPILGSLPIIGSLFRSKDKTKARTELMVFLTPRVVRSAEESYAITEQERQRLQMKDKVKISPPPTEEFRLPPAEESEEGLEPQNQQQSAPNGTPSNGTSQRSAPKSATEAMTS
jgi:general secretion pathway protein D